MLDFELLDGGYLVEFHLLSKFAWVWKSKDVRVRPQTECPLITLLVVLLQSGPSDTHVLSSMCSLELVVVYVTVPYLVAAVNHSHLTLVLVKWHQLHNLDLQIEVSVPAGCLL